MAVATMAIFSVVVIGVNCACEYSHGGRDGLLEPVLIDAVFIDVVRQINGAEVADSNLALACVQRDLCAKV